MVIICSQKYRFSFRKPDGTHFELRGSRDMQSVPDELAEDALFKMARKDGSIRVIDLLKPAILETPIIAKPSEGVGEDPTAAEDPKPSEGVGGNAQKNRNSRG